MKFALGYLKMIETEASFVNYNLYATPKLSQNTFVFYYSDKLSALVEKVLKGIMPFLPDPQRLKAIIQEL